jgi:hypothetical protein
MSNDVNKIFKDSIIQFVEMKQNDVVVTLAGVARSRKVSLASVFGNITNVKCFSSVGQTKVDVGRWSNDDAQKVPKVTDPVSEPNLMAYIGRTITGASLYETPTTGRVGRKVIKLNHCTVSLRTGVQKPVDKNGNIPKVITDQTLAIGFDVVL